MTDPHYDDKYAVGSDNQCDIYMCCRSENGYPTEPSWKAGEWGSFMCDTPEKVIRSFLKFVKSDIQPQLLFWTGDNAPHDIWRNTEEEAIASTANITKMMNEELAGMDTSYYPIQGNHDTWPCNI